MTPRMVESMRRQAAQQAARLVAGLGARRRVARRLVAGRLVGGLGDKQLAGLAARAGSLERALATEGEERHAAALDDEDWLRWVYRATFDREPDITGLQHWRQQLGDGMSRQKVRAILASSEEAHTGQEDHDALDGFHASRIVFTRSLPPARRILDLGGTSLDSTLGSLLVMGYPYDFDELLIIDLPSTERHALYQAGDNQDLDSVRGPIRYQFQSMVDLDDLPDHSFDLVVSGQTFEHLTPADGERLLAHVARLLTSDGVLALDTPNREVTAIQCALTGDPFINPDHKIEYTHAEMLALFAAAGLVVQRAYGLGYMPATVRDGVWQPYELAANRGMFVEVEKCYSLAYLARRR